MKNCVGSCKCDDCRRIIPGSINVWGELPKMTDYLDQCKNHNVLLDHNGDCTKCDIETVGDGYISPDDVKFIRDVQNKQQYLNEYGHGITCRCSEGCGNLWDDVVEASLNRTARVLSGKKEDIKQDSNDSLIRKNSPVFSGVLQYFPDAIMEISRHSKKGNDKHNPGQPLHWAKEKSTDHADCVARHLIDIGPNWDEIDPETQSYHAAALAWRALALLQTVLERNKK